MSGAQELTALTAEQVLLERRSVRQYQRDVVISDAELNELFTLATAAPSSWNLQQWRFLVVKEQAKKDQLLPIAYGQKQVSDASVVVVVLGDTQANETGHQIYDAAVAGGYLTQEIRDTLVGQIDGAYSNAQFAREEAIKNASLAAMQLMIAAKAKGYDTVAMGGYDKQALINHLNIPERFVPVMLIPIGVAAAPGRASGRLPLEAVVLGDTF